MKAARQKSALVWLAILTIAVVTVARAEAGESHSTPYTESVLKYLAAHQDAETLAASGVPRLLESWAGMPSGNSAHGAGSGVWQAMLPVVFIGLAAPLSLVAAGSRRSLGRMPAAPSLPFRFQRPPPTVCV